MLLLFDALCQPNLSCPHSQVFPKLMIELIVPIKWKPVRAALVLPLLDCVLIMAEGKATQVKSVVVNS